MEARRPSARRFRGLRVILLSSILGITAVALRGQDRVGNGSALASQPVLVEVRVEGNASVPTERILAAITTKASDISPLERYTILLTDLLRQVPLDSPIVADLDEIADEVTSGLRLLNAGAATEDVTRIKQIYNGYGFHDVVISVKFEVDTVHQLAVVKYVVNEADRYRLRGIRWSYSGADPPPDDVRSTLETPSAMIPGEYFSQENLYADINRAVSILKNNGYPSASLAYPPRVFNIRRTQATEFGSNVGFDSAEVEIAPGKRFRFGPTEVRRDTVTTGRPVETEFVLDQLEYQEGEWYSREKLDASQANIYGLGLFDLVSFVDSVNPASPDLVAYRIFTRRRAQNDLRIVPDFSLERRSRDYVANVGTSVLYNRINLVGWGEILGVSGHVLIPFLRNEDLQWGVLGTFTKPSWPSFFVYGTKKLRGQVSVSYDSKIESVISDDADPSIETSLRNQRFGAAFELSWQLPENTFFNRLVIALKGQWNKYTNVNSYVAQYERNLQSEAERSGLDFDVVRDYARHTTLRPYILQGDDASLLDPADTAAYRAFDNIKQTYIFPAATFVGDRRNDFFAPTHGYLIEVGGELGLSGLFGRSGFPKGTWNGGFVRTEINWREFAELGSRSIIAYRAHVGLVTEFGQLPLTPQSNRFFAGGANSIRGWGVREMLATRDDLGLPSGASDSTRRLLELLNLRNGGLGLLEFNVELRYRLFAFPSGSSLAILNDVLLIPFVDAGNAFFRDSEDRLPIVPNIGVAAGVSLGYNTPIGPIRGGVGVPVYDPVDLSLLTTRDRLIFNRKPLDLMVFHVGIGHAF